MVFGGGDRIELSDEEFRLLASFVYEYAGLYFDDANRFLLESRLQNRLKEHYFDSFLKYYHYLLFHPDRVGEMNAMLDVITTNETYFFREKKQLDALAEEILPELARKNGSTKRLRIWSAGCSTGEEPYTLGILVRESGLFDSSWKIDIVGTDKMMGLIGDCDIIMCRNVIIYFDGGAKARAANSFFRKLVPDGYLLLGHSESLMNITTVFRLKHLAKVMVYQKPGRAG